MNAMTLKEAKKELKQPPKEKERIIREYTTGEGILLDDKYISKPNRMFNKQGMYQANIALSEEEGQQLTKDLEQMLQQQYEERGEETELRPITSILEPITTMMSPYNADTAEYKGKYILRTQAQSQMWEEKDIGKPYTRIVDDEIVQGMADKGWCIRLKESTVQLVVRFEAYTTTYSTGIVAVLKGIDVIKPSEVYKGKGEWLVNGVLNSST